RQRERDGVARPGAEIEVVLDHVRRPQFLRFARARRLVLACVDRQVEGGVVEAAEAGAVKSGREAQVEHRAGARLRDDELGRHLLRDGEVVLAGELERFQFELDLVAVLLPRPKLDRSEVEAPYGVRVAGRARTLARATAGFALMISTTATTIAMPASSVVAVIASLRKSAPSRTATTGFTKA